MPDFHARVVELIQSGISKSDFQKQKIKLAKEFRLKKIPTDIEILLNCTSPEFKKLKGFLTTKPGRTGSGVAVIAIMTHPAKCPHGKCIYCPGGPGSHFGDIPQSYTGNEPATMRAIRNRYDPYLQVMNRLEQYIILGHNPEKVELIIMGGTFPSLDRDYKYSFITDAFKAMNDFSELFYTPEFDILKFKEFFELPGKVDDAERTMSVQEKLLRLKTKTRLKAEQERNETSKIRCVGLTIETRPDYGMLEHANEMLELGCTRVELGVQTTDDDILKRIKRGHGIKETIESTQILKDLGFKINYHVMPGLPGAKDDLMMLRKIIDDPLYRPDMLKIYPCMVMPGTELEKEYNSGRFKPISTEEAAELISGFKRYVPEWIRIMRVQRDIPTKVTSAGVDRTNLRQYISMKTTEKGISCRCIRCREPAEKLGRVNLKVIEYDASGGIEYFICLTDDKYLAGFCRLRLPSRQLRNEITPTTAIVRELHVYGRATGLGEKGDIQHRGFGEQLLKKAEEISKSKGKDKILVISGIGVREYYMKLGYKKEGFYMAKFISSC